MVLKPSEILNLESLAGFQRLYKPLYLYANMCVCVRTCTSFWEEGLNIHKMPKQFIRVPKGSVILLSPDILTSLQRNCREDHESLDPSVSYKENGHVP